MQIIQTIAEVISAIAAVVVAAAAIPGLNAWRKQTKGKVEYELARRYLRAIYKLRDAVKIVRNPFISVSEMDDSLLKQGKEVDDTENRNWAVYATRWQKVSEAFSDLEVESREAEVLWGKEFKNLEKEPESLIRKLRAEIALFVRGHSSAETDSFLYDSGEDDAFTIEINNSIRPIEKYLSKHLDLK